MRKVLLGAAMTLDGYIARADGSVDYLAMTKEASELMAGFFAIIDIILMGRKTLDAAIALSGGSYKSPVRIPPTSSRAPNRPASAMASFSLISLQSRGCDKFERAPASTFSTWAEASSPAASSKPI